MIHYKTDLETLRQEILCFSPKTKKVRLPCRQTVNPRFFIVGESPSLDGRLPPIHDTFDVKVKTPSGKLVKETLQTLGIQEQLKECYFTDAIKYGFKRRLSKADVCSEIWLKTELIVINPKIVLTFRQKAKRIVYGLNPSTIKYKLSLKLPYIR